MGLQPQCLSEHDCAHDWVCQDISQCMQEDPPGIFLYPQPKWLNTQCCPAPRQDNPRPGQHRPDKEVTRPDQTTTPHLWLFSCVEASCRGWLVTPHSPVPPFPLLSCPLTRRAPALTISAKFSAQAAARLCTARSTGSATVCIALFQGLSSWTTVYDSSGVEPREERMAPVWGAPTPPPHRASGSTLPVLAEQVRGCLPRALVGTRKCQWSFSLAESSLRQCCLRRKLRYTERLLGFVFVTSRPDVVERCSLGLARLSLTQGECTCCTKPGSASHGHLSVDWCMRRNCITGQAGAAPGLHQLA